MSGISAKSIQADAKSTATLLRHPKDNWVRADPWPLSANMMRVLQGLVRALCPPPEEGAPTDDALLEEVNLHVRKTLPYMNPMTARGVLLVMWLLDVSPRWRLRGLRRLQSLPTEEASQQLEVMSHTALAGKLVLAARATVLTAYFDQPAVHTAIGYEPVAFMRQRIETRGELQRGKVDFAALQPDEATLRNARGDQS